MSGEAEHWQVSSPEQRIPMRAIEEVRITVEYELGLERAPLIGSKRLDTISTISLMIEKKWALLNGVYSCQTFTPDFG